MTGKHARTVPSGAVDEESVALFLESHPDFFERHTELLASLRLPHVRESKQTVSLMERQAQVLRERNETLERKFKELLDVARSNEALTDKIHRFAQRLLRASSLPATVTAIETALREDFDAMHAVLVLFLPDTPALQSLEGSFLRVLRRDAAEMKTFETFLSAAQPRCGQVRDAQRDWLFGPDGVGIGSVALAPLGRDVRVGFMAIGSSDSERFHPGMSTDFLARIGEHVREALDRFR